MRHFTTLLLFAILCAAPILCEPVLAQESATATNAIEATAQPLAIPVAGASDTVAVETAAPAQGPGELVFSFISSAYFMEKNWGQGMAFEGVKRIADVAHAHGVPVTWLVNAKSAEAAKDLFTQYHEAYGDEVGLILTPSAADSEPWGGESFYMRRKLSRDQILKWAQEEIASIRKSLPWAEITMGGGGHRSKAMVQVFEKLGLKAVWGHCWEQTYTDGISDRGAPWGFYYANPEAYKTPNSKPGGLVAVEWTARDLNLAFRTGQPETYSTDPDDVRRGNITSHRDIDYWKAFVDQYRRNARYNAMVPLMVHQEAHEMECSPTICVNKEDVISNDADMLDELFAYIKESEIKIVTASRAVDAYRAFNQATPPTYALFKNLAPSFKEMNPGLYEDVAGNREIFVYYDKNGQLFFDSGTVGPSFVRTYMGATDAQMEDAEVPGVEYPPVPAVSEQVLPGRFIYQVTVDSPEKMPYGIALWGDFEGCAFVSQGLPGQKVLPGALAFSPVILQEGANTFQLILECTGPQWEWE